MTPEEGIAQIAARVRRFEQETRLTERGEAVVQDLRAIIAQVGSGVPTQGIDRDALRLQVWKAATGTGGKPTDEQIDYYTDCILALLRPFDGVWISREEVPTALNALRIAAAEYGDERGGQEIRALAEWLEREAGA